MVLLSQFGFDAGLIDEIRRTNGRQLELADREAFYQIMEILQLPGQQQAIQASHREGEPAVITITDYLKNPRSLQGQFVTIAGDVRQISRVAIVNSKMQRRLGRDHYWQLDLSIPIGDEAIQLKSNAADKEGLIFRNRYPVQVCIADLPPTLRQAMDDIRLGIDQRKLLREPVTIQGVFFKLWSYQSGRTIRSGANRVQLSPLIIASHITVHPENITDRAGMGTYVAIIFIGGMALIAVFLIRMGRQDRDAHQRTAATRHGHNNSQPLDFESN